MNGTRCHRHRLLFIFIFYYFYYFLYTMGIFMGWLHGTYCNTLLKFWLYCNMIFKNTISKLKNISQNDIYIYINKTFIQFNHALTHHHNNTTYACYRHTKHTGSRCQVLIQHAVQERERNVLFNDALNTFYLWLYGIGHMVKDHSDSERGNPLPPHRLLLSINSKGSFICTISQTG